MMRSANAICQPADFFFHVYYYHFQVLLDTYYFKVPFDVKAIVSVAKKWVNRSRTKLAAIQLETLCRVIFLLHTTKQLLSCHSRSSVVQHLYHSLSSKSIHENGRIPEGISKTMQQESCKICNTTRRYYEKFLIWFETPGRSSLTSSLYWDLQRNNSIERINFAIH